MRETWVRSLGREDSLEKEMATHSSPLAWKIPRATIHGFAKCQTRLSDFTFTSHFLALEKEMAPHSSVLAWRIPMDRGDWWATVHGLAKSDMTEQLSTAHYFSSE